MPYIWLLDHSKNYVTTPPCVHTMVQCAHPFSSSGWWLYIPFTRSGLVVLQVKGHQPVLGAITECHPRYCRSPWGCFTSSYSLRVWVGDIGGLEGMDRPRAFQCGFHGNASMGWRFEGHPLFLEFAQLPQQG